MPSLHGIYLKLQNYTSHNLISTAQQSNVISIIYKNVAPCT